MKRRQWKKFGTPTGVKPKQKTPYLRGIRSRGPNGPVVVTKPG